MLKAPFLRIVVVILDGLADAQTPTDCPDFPTPFPLANPEALKQPTKAHPLATTPGHSNSDFG